MEPRLVRLSKRMSYLLRHRPGQLAVDPAGWALVDDLVAALAARGPADPTPSPTRADVDLVVARNDKRRFEIVTGPDGRDRIRASQGHSIDVDLGMAPSEPPPLLFHGTSAAAVPAILAEGLRRGRRQHVHLSADRGTAHAVGARRRTAVAVLTVDAAAMAAQGYRFCRSANGVWLTDHVPARFLAAPS